MTDNRPAIERATELLRKAATLRAANSPVTHALRKTEQTSSVAFCGARIRKVARDLGTPAVSCGKCLAVALSEGEIEGRRL